MKNKIPPLQAGFYFGADDRVIHTTIYGILRHNKATIYCDKII